MWPLVPIPRTPQHQSFPSTALLPPSMLSVFFLVCGLFLLWGIPNNLNDVLIQQFMKSFAMRRFRAGLVQSAFYLGYFLMALPAGLLLRRAGYKVALTIGLLIYAAGCFLFVPAADSENYLFFLGALFVIATGLSFLETAANSFVAQLGPSSTSERRLNIAQSFNPLGAIAGVFIGSRFIFSGVELSSSQIAAMNSKGTYVGYLHQETLRVQEPYVVLGIVVSLWVVMISLMRFPVVNVAQERNSQISIDWRALIRERHLLLALPAQFLYVGAQVGTWSHFIKYAEEYAHQPERIAGVMLTGTLAVFGLGRFSSVYLMRRVPPSQLMSIYAACNIMLLLLGVLDPGPTGMLAVILTSFFMSIMFPTIFALGLKNLGSNSTIATSLLIMTIIGGGVITPVMGWIAERRSTAAAYQLPLYAYVFILLFSIYMTRYLKTQHRS